MKIYQQCYFLRGNTRKHHIAHTAERTLSVYQQLPLSIVLRKIDVDSDFLDTVDTAINNQSRLPYSSLPIFSQLWITASLPKAI